jgi:hypothetical protein
VRVRSNDSENASADLRTGWIETEERMGASRDDQKLFVFRS